MSEVDRRTIDSCAPIVDAANRLSKEQGLGTIGANFDFVKELASNRINGINCSDLVSDVFKGGNSPPEVMAENRVLKIRPDAKEALRSVFPSADSLMKELDRNHDGKISKKEVINRGLELFQINESGSGDKRTRAELEALGPVYGYLRYKGVFDSDNKSDPKTTKEELKRVFYKEHRQK
jgi:hypothetical protein